MSGRGNGKDVMLQAFHWNLVKTQGDGTLDGRNISWYRILTDSADRIASCGFTVIYLPPPWRDDSSWDNAGKHGGGEGYFWHDFDLDSRYGTKNELKELVLALHSRGIKAISDLVVNHRDASRMTRDVWEYPGECWANGGTDTGGSFFDGKYDMNLSNRRVIDRIRNAMTELMDECGIDGWRWDYVRGYETQEVVNWIKSTRKEEYLSVGEYWQDSAYIYDDPMVKRYGADEGNRIIGWAQESGGCAFDIILKRHIQTGDPRNLKFGLAAQSDPEKSAGMVTFTDNHDTGASPYSPANGWGQECWPCPVNFKSKAYAFILTMPGIPCVYWPDCFDWGHENEIKELIALRKTAGLTSSSRWEDLTATHYGFAAKIKNSSGIDALAVSIGSDYRENSDDWIKGFEKKGDYTIWINKNAL